ncbi:hypothetical protein A4X13_0g4452 [Tilletia indica]|uniref:Uncharacterized protein n=1 Tax=Tilletia indica TaxID=43049 RepID=A0A177TNG1_9BASI|nr:hypothetical protein A4X13_0g4452 [Tilletia indica]
MSDTSDHKSSESSSSQDKSNEAAPNSAKRGRGRPKGSRKKPKDAAASDHPGNDLSIDGDEGTAGDDEPSHLVPGWDPTQWQDVLLLTRELFSDLVPCCEFWTDEQRVRIGNMLVDLGFALIPSTY